ncbi:IclR family transcriptional regulator [Celeribacter neptunius]|uniref:Transcriptional regulator, IclR family n=1 Tax=Celeribacter neptunius TaxID=588602 RepID=A0A1I3UBR6_9RHOB|nr:helix-turn-helix domain-containing protein [Celeribacter neptunius]SFJ79306.1 transcriptional regulator, IclR family [Celeribacter neptunius]
MDSTLLKGLMVLERVVAADAPVGVSALARDLGLPKSNVHRTLSSLREAGYVGYDADSRHYYPSLKLAQMGNRIAARFPFQTALLPLLQQLVSGTGESAHFVYLDGESVMFACNALPPTSVASVIPDNLTLRWDDTAFGVAIASALPDHAVKSLLGAAKVDPMARARLDAARAEGVAVIRRHDTRRIFEIAAPVRSGWDTVIGAIGITGPAMRFSEDRLEVLQQAVRDFAEQAFAETARLRQADRKTAQETEKVTGS